MGLSLVLQLTCLLSALMVRHTLFLLTYGVWDCVSMSLLRVNIHTAMWRHTLLSLTSLPTSLSRACLIDSLKAGLVNNYAASQAAASKRMQQLERQQFSCKRSLSFLIIYVGWVSLISFDGLVVI